MTENHTAARTRLERTLEFRCALRSALRGRCWTQADLARRVGVSQPTVGNWLRGRFTPSPHDVFAIEDALQLTPGELTIRLGYLRVTHDSGLERLFKHLLGSAEGRGILGSIGGADAATMADRSGTALAEPAPGPVGAVARLHQTLVPRLDMCGADEGQRRS